MGNINELAVFEYTFNTENIIPNLNTAEIDERLAEVNKKLEKYTNQADKFDYAVAVVSGIVCGLIDSLFVGEFKITKERINISHEKVNKFIISTAQEKGYKGERLNEAIGFLENNYKVAQDNVWKGAERKISAKTHHLDDLAHHPTPIGLVSAIIVPFFNLGIFNNRDGEWMILNANKNSKEMFLTWIPVIITGVLNWVVSILERHIENENMEVPEYVKKIMELAAYAPVLIEIAKFANNWCGHLVSDMGGSKSTAGGGMGIPEIFISLLKEISCLPGISSTELPKTVESLYKTEKIDFRHELVIYEQLKKQAIPVIVNEIIVRTFYFVRRLAIEIKQKNVNGLKDLEKINWENVIPFRNRTIIRMTTVSSATFMAVDMTDALVRAAAESVACAFLIPQKIVSRINYVNMGRLAISIGCEAVYEYKEEKYLREKLELTAEKSEKVVEAITEYRQKIESVVANYLAEDIQQFLNGFDEIDRAILKDDADGFIHGNVTIQSVLGRKPQFTNQEEFDSLMNSEEALVL